MLYYSETVIKLSIYYYIDRKLSMSLIKLISALTIASALLVIAMPYQVSAETLEQSQTLEQEFECKVEGYGIAKCYGKQRGEQHQKIEGFRRADGKFIRVHKVVDTGVDGYTLATVAGTLVTGVGAAILKIKNRA